jgi:UDP-glucose 4-epimerase
MEYVAITGSAGYIGSVLAKHCKELGYGVIGIDLKYDISEERVYHSKYPYVDIAIGACISNTLFSAICNEYKVSKIFHLAASADVELSQRIPFHFYQNNVGNTSHMLHNLVNTDWITRSPQVIYSSTAAVYKEHIMPVVEISEKGSPNAYGRSKLASEYLLKELFDFYQIPSVTFRYFNVAGARGDVGDNLHTNHIIPILCKSAISGKPFKLFGIDYSTVDGTCVRDYVDVNDIARAHIHASEYLNTNRGNFTFNLGTKTGTSLLQLIRIFEDTVGVDLVYQISDRRDGDPAFLVANPSLFIEETKFQYTSDLNTIIESTWNYYNFLNEANNGI